MGSRTLLLKYLVVSVICSIALTYATGFIQNQPYMGYGGNIQTSVNYYGYPIAWRTNAHMTSVPDFMPANFAIDILLWIALFFLAIFILNGVRHF